MSEYPSSDQSSSYPIRVGIVGLGGWASYSHLPAFQSLPQFEVTAVASRSLEKAQRNADRWGIPHAYGSVDELVAQPDIDLVVVLTPGQSHAQPTREAVYAGKDVYVEWPLTTNTAESEELLALARARGVRHLVGLQRRFAPSIRYVRDLIDEGYLGKLRGVRMSVGTNGFGPERPPAMRTSIDPANFTHLLSIYGGHFLDLLFHTVGPPADLTAFGQNQFPQIRITDTQDVLASTASDQIAVAGTLQRGGLFQVQIEGGQAVPTGLLIDITGTRGVLRLSNEETFASRDNTVHGASGDASGPAPLAVPASYDTGTGSELTEIVRELAELYSAYASDRATGTSHAPTFDNAVQQHRLIDRITNSAADSTTPTGER